MHQSQQNDPVLGFIINQMEEKLEDAMVDFQKEKSSIDKELKETKEANQNLSKMIEIYKSQQKDQEKEVEKLDHDTEELEKDFTKITNFIHQRPTQSDQNKWTYRTISGLASDLLQKIQEEKKKQQDLYSQSINLDFLQNGK